MVYMKHAELTADMAEKMRSGGELSSLRDMLDYVVEYESRHGIKLAEADILRAYWQACDDVVDSFVSNAWETNDPNFDSAAEAAAWEAKRPSAVRRNELLARFAGFPEIV